MAITRGSDTQVRILSVATGQIIRMWSPQSFTSQLDHNTERQQRLGTRIKPVRQTINGHTGTMVMEVEGPELDDMQDEQIAAYLGADPEYKIEIIHRVYYPGRRAARTYRYPGVMFDMSFDSSGTDDPATITINWTSEPREKVS